MLLAAAVVIGGVGSSVAACGGSSDAGFGDTDAAGGGDGSSGSSGDDASNGNGSGNGDGGGGGGNGDAGRGDGGQGNGDASGGGDAAGDAGRDAAGFACGSLTCSPDEYCQSFTGGPQLGDGGTASTFSCQPAPVGCNGTPTCACVHPVGACRCTETNGEVRVDCQGI